MLHNRALYRQTRVGWRGQTFQMYKFTTMMVQEDDHEIRIADDESDPRITSFGRWLRRYGLDELPQLVHVLHGDMSLVGPRPFPLDQDRRLRELHPLYTRRQVVRPGITGLAQLSSSRDPKPVREDVARLVALDLAYTEHCSLTLDVVILLRTAVYLLRGQDKGSKYEHSHHGFQRTNRH